MVEAPGSNDQGFASGTGLSTASGRKKLPRGGCSLRRDAGWQKGAMTAGTERARRTVELAFNVYLLLHGSVELRRAWEASVRVGNSSKQAQKHAATVQAAKTRAKADSGRRTGGDAGILSLLERKDEGGQLKGAT